MSDRRHQDVFFMHSGPPPWTCYFCGEDVEYEGERPYAVHHLNHDHDDNRPENLVAAHRGCHTGHHSAGWWSKLSGPQRSKLALRMIPPENRSLQSKRAMHRRWHVREGKPCGCEEGVKYS